MSTENQVHLKGDFRHEEIECGAMAITPGMLVAEDSSGELVAHATEGGVAARMVAEVDALQGHTLTDDYADGDPVRIDVEHPGNECQILLKAGEDVAIGDILISAGDGTLIKEGSESSGVTIKDHIAIAREALNLSGSGEVDALLHVMIL